MENYLKPLKAGIKKHKIATFDIESNNWTDFLILGFYDGEEYKEFLNIETFLFHVLREKYLHYRIYAHFGGRFDFLFLLEYLKYPVDLIEVNGRIISLKVRIRENKHIYFIDSFSFLLMSLDKLSKTFNIENKKGKIDFSKKLIINNELREYLKNDVKGLFEIINLFQDKINSIGANLKITIASVSLDLFRRKYLKTELPNYKELEEIIRGAYYGGRVEVYKKYFKSEKNGNLFYYDFNSLYPSVMSDNFFPVGNPLLFPNYNFNSSDIGFCEIETYIPKTLKIPPLPQKINGMLLYQTGYTKGFYPLLYCSILQNLGIPFKTRNAILFEKQKLFKNFVSDLYNLRMENKNNSLGYITKILLNSLYGKFAQKREKNIFILNPEEIKENFICYNEKNDLWYYQKESYSKHILPAISCYVTGYAHLKLYNLLYQYQDNIYYCDTDSVFIDRELKTGQGLGQLKLEDEITEAIFLNPKFYAYKNIKGKKILKGKGFFQDKLKYNFYLSALFDNNYKLFDQDKKRLSGFKSALISLDNKEKDFLFIRNFKKSLKNIDKKRKFIKFESLPFHSEQGKN